MFVLVVVLAGVAQGVSAPLVNILVMLIPALGFVPAFYFAVKLHRATDTDTAAREWRKTVGLAVVGLVLFAVASLIVFQAGA
ncbi:hypothetical protein [Actinoplanes sp. L3-i22]|uniref:hypothetical protein n=1 Tax=Actinoplanes sp. L3-i22 TaxID=2836373 RepID=UPI001C85F45C|nr:hypothetical protein [Actinoplanes sp. L3-i22]